MESYPPTRSKIRRLGNRLSGKLTEIGGEDLFDVGAADGSDSREGKVTGRDFVLRRFDCCELERAGAVVEKFSSGHIT